MGAIIQGIESSLSPALLIALADDAGAGSPDPQVLASAADAAEAEVRAALAGALRLAAGAELPALARDIAATLAIERLFHRRRETPPDPWAGRAERARALLREAASGRLRLDGAPPRKGPRSTRPPSDALRPPKGF